jgi:hypothetical protein
LIHEKEGACCLVEKSSAVELARDAASHSMVGSKEQLLSVILAVAFTVPVIVAAVGNPGSGS